MLAHLGGIYSSHLSPSTIICIASVQPRITWLGANLGLGIGLGLGLTNQVLGLGLTHLVGRELRGLGANLGLGIGLGLG